MCKYTKIETNLTKLHKVEDKISLDTLRMHNLLKCCAIASTMFAVTVIVSLIATW
jgi:hypothetical protein